MNDRIEYLISLTEAQGQEKAKKISETYLYSKAQGAYEKNIFDFLMNCKHVDKNHESIQTLISDIKRRNVPSYVVKVLESPKTILCYGNAGLPRAFKVMVAKDVRKVIDGDLLYIDVTDVLRMNEGGSYNYRHENIDIIVSYLIGGMNEKIYIADPSKITNRNTLIQHSTSAYANLFSYIIDRIRAGAVPNAREKTKYVAALFFQVNVLRKEYTESVKSRAMNIANIENKDMITVDMIMEGVKDPFAGLDGLVRVLKEVLNNQKLDESIIVETWMRLFNTGTQFGIEYYPAFANILIYTHVGAYLTSQKTIESIVKADLVMFTNEVFKLGGELL